MLFEYVWFTNQKRDIIRPLLSLSRKLIESLKLNCKTFITFIRYYLLISPCSGLILSIFQNICIRPVHILKCSFKETKGNYTAVSFHSVMVFFGHI